jgi:hypothetical protein
MIGGRNMPDAPLTNKQAAALIADLRDHISTIDDQASTIVATLLDARAQLADLAAQRQPLVEQADSILQGLLVAPWRQALRDGGDISSP